MGLFHVPRHLIPSYQIVTISRRCGDLHDLPRHDDRDRGAEEAKRKGRRNTIYLVCGILIAASMLWVLVSLCTGKPIFWAEVVALWAFAVSWLTKGRAHETAGRYLRSAGRLLRGGRAGPARRPLDSR